MESNESIVKFTNTLEKSKLLAQVALEDAACTLAVFHRFNELFQEEYKKLPTYQNVLEDTHMCGNIKETAHSRILYSLLQSSIIQKHFIRYFIHKDVNLANIAIPYPDKDRIDLTIKGCNFFLIIENKVNNAPEQEHQIERYVKLAQKTYPLSQIYVLYLNRDVAIPPSEYSLPKDLKERLGTNFICKSFRTDILDWLYQENQCITFDTEPYLKSSIVTYIGYLESLFNNTKRFETMNKKLDEFLIKDLELEGKSNRQKIEILDENLDNIEKLQERLEELRNLYQTKEDQTNYKAWYAECSEELKGQIILTREDKDEFGFDFVYHRLPFRCMVSSDDEGYYWGIRKDFCQERPKIEDSLKSIVLDSGYGFHNNEYNTMEWVVSDYAEPEEIVERFVTLSKIIISSQECIVGEK